MVRGLWDKLRREVKHLVMENIWTGVVEKANANKRVEREELKH